MNITLTQTKKQILPYDFHLLLNGKVAIKKTTGQMLIVTRSQVEHILLDPELDTHRRRMYQAALEVWKTSETKQ